MLSAGVTHVLCLLTLEISAHDWLFSASGGADIPSPSKLVLELTVRSNLTNLFRWPGTRSFQGYADLFLALGKKSRRAWMGGRGPGAGEADNSRERILAMLTFIHTGANFRGNR